MKVILTDGKILLNDTWYFIKNKIEGVSKREPDFMGDGTIVREK